MYLFYWFHCHSSVLYSSSHSPSCHFPFWLSHSYHQLITHRPPPPLPSTLITLLLLLLHPLLLGHSDFTVRGCSVPPVWSCRDLIQKTQPLKTFTVLFVSPYRPDIYFQSKLRCFSCTSWFSLVSTFWCLLGLCKEWDHVCINASCFDSYLPFGSPLVFPLCPKPLARLTVSSC